MAKKIKTVWDRVNDYSKKYQSGLNKVSSFNGNINESVKELINYLVSIQGINERASELLQPYIKSASVTGSSSAIFAKPIRFLYYLSASYLDKPVHKVSINQLQTTEQIPQRRGDLTKKRVNITSIDNGFMGRPISAYSIIFNYVAGQVTDPNIVFSITSTGDENVLVYDDTTTVDFDFDEKCVPLLTYMVLSKIGVEINDQMLTEYSQLGISKESVKS
jgi:hypothetical protein